MKHRSFVHLMARHTNEFHQAPASCLEGHWTNSRNSITLLPSLIKKRNTIRNPREVAKTHKCGLPSEQQHNITSWLSGGRLPLSAPTPHGLSSRQFTLLVRSHAQVRVNKQMNNTAWRVPVGLFLARLLLPSLLLFAVSLFFVLRLMFGCGQRN